MRKHSLLVLLLWSFLVAGCGGAPAQAGPTVTPATFITREQAIKNARQACWSFHLQLVGEPRNIRAQLTTLASANQVWNDGYPSDSLPLSTTVWLVQMDAPVQLVGGVLPTPGGHDPPPTPWTFDSTCAVSIDANTGQGIGLSEHS